MDDMIDTILNAIYIEPNSNPSHTPYKNSNMNAFVPTDIGNFAIRIDESCIRNDKYKNIKYISSGGYGSVYNLYHNQLKENIVVKIAFLYKSRLEKEFNEETNLQKRMNELGIGPKILATKICSIDSIQSRSEYNHKEIEDKKKRKISVWYGIPNQFQKKVGLIFMNKWDGDLLHKNYMFFKSNAEIITSTILKQIFTLHKYNYIHLDIHARNILYRKKDSKLINITISDFGLMMKYNLQRLTPTVRESKDFNFYTNIFMQDYPIYFNALQAYFGQRFESVLKHDPTYLDFAYLFSKTILKPQLKTSLIYLLKNNKDLFTNYHPKNDKDKIRFLYSVCSTEPITDKEYTTLESLLNSVFDKGKQKEKEDDIDKKLNALKKRKKDKGKQKEKKCKDYEILNPRTNRCIKDNLQNRKKVCENDKIYNGLTNRCIQRSSKNIEKVKKQINMNTK